MKIAAFNAACPVEIGDKVRDSVNRVRIITDILTMHYVKSGQVEFACELDNEGQYRKIDVVKLDWRNKQ